MIDPETDDEAARLEIEAVFARYEAALAANDVASLDAMFLQSPHTVRYGIGENLYGFDAIAAFRRSRAAGSPRRTVLRRTVAIFGHDVATTHLEFRRDESGQVGRQSQTWLRTPAGWRIIAAHVSLIADVS